MLKPASTSGFRSARLWNRLRVQLGGGVLFAVIVPVVGLGLVYPDFMGSTSGRFTLAGTAIAAMLSVFTLRTISLYPGIRSSYSVLPVLLAVYGLTFSIFFLFRLDYSRATILTSAGAMLVWLYFVQLKIERGPALRIGVVPIGDMTGLSGLRWLELEYLKRPELTVGCDLLVADFRADLSDEWEAFLADCALAGLPVLHVKQLIEARTGKVEIEHLSENSLGSLIPFMGYLTLRRAFDFIVALTAGILLLPLFAVVAVAIKLDSSGPILFRQVRIGYRGRPFRVAKFRTMIVRPEEDLRNGAMTQPNDSRVTSVGRFLRRTRIDELPQILNILQGEMSWIGPRPEAEPLSRWYEVELPFYRYRHIVPPGITGWAQVNQGHVVELDQVTSKLQYDFYYIKNFSPWLDALIVAKTIQTVITGFGSK